MKKFNLSVLSFTAFILISGCATLSKGGEQVQIIKVSTNKQEVEAAEAKLIAEKCLFVQNIEAPVAAGNSDLYGRLVIGLKNKTAEVGGNVVLSSMESHFAMPIYTKGKVYKCPRDLKSSEV